MNTFSDPIPPESGLSSQLSEATTANHEIPDVELRGLGARAVRATLAVVAAGSMMLGSSACSYDRQIEFDTGNGLATSYENPETAGYPELAQQAHDSVTPYVLDAMRAFQEEGGRARERDYSDGVRTWTSDNAIQPGSGDSSVAYKVELRRDEQRMTVYVFGTVGVDSGKSPTYEESDHRIVVEYITDEQTGDEYPGDLLMEETTRLANVMAERDTGIAEVTIGYPGSTQEAYQNPADSVVVEGSSTIVDLYGNDGENRATTSTTDKLQPALDHIGYTFVELGFRSN